jgi:hypothetical protein
VSGFPPTGYLLDRIDDIVKQGASGVGTVLVGAGKRPSEAWRGRIHATSTAGPWLAPLLRRRGRLTPPIDVAALV